MTTPQSDAFVFFGATGDLSYILEPLWNRQYVSCVQITMAEDFGVQGRGRFYDEVGAIRDVVRNYLLQVLVLLAMDAPVGRQAESMRDEKVGLLKAMRPLTPSDIVRGQFRGYCENDGVAPDSRVETFAALRLRIPVTALDVLVDVKSPPKAIFDDPAPAKANQIIAGDNIRTNPVPDSA